MRNGGSGRTRVVPGGARSAATRAGTGPSANSEGMRSLTRRDTQANSIATGAARAMNSRAFATLIARNPQISASGAASSESAYRHVRAADLQQLERSQRHKAEQHRSKCQNRYHRLAAR